jgi:hypothetical protein
MISTSQYYNEGVGQIASALVKNPAIRQAAVWGLGSALGTKLSSGKKRKQMSKEEKKTLRRQIVGTGIAGALAGGAGALV